MLFLITTPNTLNGKGMLVVVRRLPPLPPFTCKQIVSLFLPTAPVTAFSSYVIEASWLEGADTCTLGFFPFGIETRGLSSQGVG
jgi:hypothetical protein